MEKFIFKRYLRNNRIPKNQELHLVLLETLSGVVFRSFSVVALSLKIYMVNGRLLIEIVEIVGFLVSLMTLQEVLTRVRKHTAKIEYRDVCNNKVWWLDMQKM